MRCGFHLASLPHHNIASLAVPLRDMNYQVAAVRLVASTFLDEAGYSVWMKQLASLSQAGLQIVLDADGLFMADPWHALSPQLAKEDENSDRESTLIKAIDCAAKIQCGLITFSVGSGDADEDAEAILKRVALSIIRLMHRASSADVTIAIKPVLGSAIETASQFRRLLQWLPESVASDPRLGWAADVAVMARRGEMPIGDRLERDSDRLVCVYLSDVSHGFPGDRRFGEGDLSIERIAKAIHELPFAGPVIFRIEGHGEAGLVIAKEAIQLASCRHR